MSLGTLRFCLRDSWTGQHAVVVVGAGPFHGRRPRSSGPFRRCPAGGIGAQDPNPEAWARLGETLPYPPVRMEWQPPPFNGEMAAQQPACPLPTSIPKGGSPGPKSEHSPWHGMYILYPYLLYIHVPWWTAAAQSSHKYTCSVPVCALPVGRTPGVRERKSEMWVQMGGQVVRWQACRPPRQATSNQQPATSKTGRQAGTVTLADLTT